MTRETFTRHDKMRGSMRESVGESVGEAMGEAMGKVMGNAKENLDYPVLKLGKTPIASPQEVRKPGEAKPPTDPES